MIHVWGATKTIEGQKFVLEISQQTGANFGQSITAQHFIISFWLIYPLGNKRRQGAAYDNIGNALVPLSRYDEAIEYHKTNSEIAQQTNRN
jgi:hypothetical protein